MLFVVQIDLLLMLKKIIIALPCFAQRACAAVIWAALAPVFFIHAFTLGFNFDFINFMQLSGFLFLPNSPAALQQTFFWKFLLKQFLQSRKLLTKISQARGWLFLFLVGLSEKPISLLQKFLFSLRASWA